MTEPDEEPGPAGTAAPDGTEVYRRAEIYEAVYRGRGKDYAAEAAVATAAIRRVCPDAERVLDVACGTGSHLRYFAEDFPHVEGIDLSEDMLRLARRKLPHVPVCQGDMRDFRLGRSFSAITCMFSSIGYLPSVAELNQTLATFAAHLTPDGVVVIEPWWFPETFTPEHVRGDTGTVGGRAVCRVSHTSWVEVAGQPTSRMEVHYLSGEPGVGIRHFSDVHMLTLFTREEYEAAFRRAGLEAEFVPYDQAGPGLFVGARRAPAAPPPSTSPPTTPSPSPSTTPD